MQVAAHAASSKQSSAPCNVEVPVIGGLVGGVCEAAGAAGGAVGGLVSEAASTVGNGILELLAKWMIGAATAITILRRARDAAHEHAAAAVGVVSGAVRADGRPRRRAGAARGARSDSPRAAIRRSPEALAATLAGIARAGIGTGLVVALTVIGLSVADQVSSAVVASSPDTFWATVAHAWGSGGFGGFGSSALAMLIALIEVFAAIFVWLELIVRDAAIYVAVLFFPAALAAAIWPALAAWPGRLGRLLMLFVILKPVALIVLSFAGNAAAAGLSFSGGVLGLGRDDPRRDRDLRAGRVRAVGAHVPARGGRRERLRGRRCARGGRGRGRAMGTAARCAAQAACATSRGSVSGRRIRRRLLRRRRKPWRRELVAGAGPSSGGPSANGTGAAGGSGAGAEDGTLPVGAERIGAGSIGAAAGMSGAIGAPPAHQAHRRRRDGSQSQTTPARPQAAGPTDETPPPGALVAVPDGPSGDERAGRPTAAGGASTDASPQRRWLRRHTCPHRGGAVRGAGDGGSVRPARETTPTLARSPRRRTPPRPPALARESTRPRPALHAVDDGEEE